jgi:hypothetical protein
VVNPLVHGEHYGAPPDHPLIDISIFPNELLLISEYSFLAVEAILLQRVWPLGASPTAIQDSEPSSGSHSPAGGYVVTS